MIRKATFHDLEQIEDTYNEHFRECHRTQRAFVSRKFVRKLNGAIHQNLGR